ncbi:hypothetical protein [Pseudomonas sp. SCB32]|uniref:hypothetical protein n=1 Tax=Pseudomonas sp. SCB32 TaxID=2653853 RepID=UPI0012645ADA|nr:hypothetical protein [Pseudomonas sp. SCB32]
MAANWWDLLLTGLAGVSAFVGVAAALVRALIMLWRASDFELGYFARGQLKTLTEVCADARTEGELANYLDSEMELAKFRAVSGVRANRKQMLVLIKLFRAGIWAPEEVRAAARYLKMLPLGQYPRIHFEPIDILEAWSALIVSIALTLSGALVWAALIVKMPIYGFLLGAAGFLLSVLVAGWVGKTYEAMRSARRIKAYLDEHPNVLHAAGNNVPTVKAAA